MTAGPPAGSLLTPRCLRILQLVAEGKSDVDIAKELAISHKTVNYHVESIKRTLKVSTRIEAVVFALRNNLIF
jgi:DNA-binding NarL/FixJ family response regulator